MLLICSINLDLFCFVLLMKMAEFFNFNKTDFIRSRIYQCLLSLMFHNKIINHESIEHKRLCKVSTPTQWLSAILNPMTPPQGWSTFPGFTYPTQKTQIRLNRNKTFRNWLQLLSHQTRISSHEACNVQTDLVKIGVKNTHEHGILFRARVPW